jgi:hypothetical protein
MTYSEFKQMKKQAELQINPDHAGLAAGAALGGVLADANYDERIHKSRVINFLKGALYGGGAAGAGILARNAADPVTRAQMSEALKQLANPVVDSLKNAVKPITGSK